MPLKQLQRFVDEISDVLPLLLTVINIVPTIDVVLFEDVDHRKDLTIIGDECLTNQF